ncbi:hypothetical protein BY458DRAFT_556941 [Sporodiniella umbellata]|nr:hypothetical protein BY458DRAFT_556941 [Sporodiniella umbellata]
MKSHLIVGALISGALLEVQAGILNSRIFSACGYLNSKIYCFGGDLAASINDFNVDNKLYSLEINQFYGESSEVLNNKWNLVTPELPFEAEGRRTPEFTVLPDGKRFILVGGQNLGPTGNANRVFVNQTILYNAVDNTWETLPDYSETNRTERQIYFGTATNLPSKTQDTIGFYGGFEDRSNTSSPMVSIYGTIIPPTGDKTTSVRGFDSITVFNTTSKAWSHFTPQTNIPPNFFVNSQTATLNPKTGKIYYMGGTYYSPSTSSRFSFSNSYVFDTMQGSWSLVKFTAQPNGKIPSDRLYHSATLMPNSEDIILYGGTNTGVLAVTDFCYTLNLNSNVWTEQVNLTVPGSVTSNGARFGHSPVLVNTTLFILFGKDLNGSPSPNLLTFDVSDVSNIHYTAIYPPVDNKDKGGNSTGTHGSDDPNSSSGLSSGAKAGIAVGSVVGAAVIISGALLLYRRKNTHSKGYQQGDQNVMQVDWDRIESQYREVQPPPGYSSSGARPSGEINRQTPNVHYEKSMS